MARIKQEVAVNGRWTATIYPVMRHIQPYRMSCCDCGLVHDVEFWIEDNRVAMRVARNGRSTGQVRRHRAKT
jgi:hypothetical protein